LIKYGVQKFVNQASKDPTEVADPTVHALNRELTSSVATR
jgi:hypothetical protein